MDARELAPAEPSEAWILPCAGHAVSRRRIGVILDGLEYPAVVGAQSVAVPLDHRRQPHERLARRGAQVQSSSDQDSSFSAPRTMAGPVADLELA